MFSLQEEAGVDRTRKQHKPHRNKDLLRGPSTEKSCTNTDHVKHTFGHFEVEEQKGQR